MVADLERAKGAAARFAEGRGVRVRLHGGFIHGDAQDAGVGLGSFLVGASEGLHIWGGETTVQLPAAPGRGGRCPQLALAAALELRGHHEIALLAAGSDGADGNGEAAGALVDGGTLERAALHTLGDAGRAEEAATRALERCDAGTLLEAAGALVDTGPTGTNVMDLMIGAKGVPGTEPAGV